MRKTLHLLTTALLICCFAAKAADRDTLHILCIGNSFSWDAVEQELAPICASAGQPILIGNLYYGGCSLEQHYRFLDSDTAAYSFRLIENGVRTIHEPYTLRQALRLCQWNHISFQQASHDSGIQSSYEPYLSQLIDSVRIYQPQAQLCWLQTWSYSQEASHIIAHTMRHRHTKCTPHSRRHPMPRRLPSQLYIRTLHRLLRLVRNTYWKNLSHYSISQCRYD